MKKQSDIQALWSSQPSLIITFATIILILALVLISWGACLYGTISSCTSRRRLRSYDDQLERRKEIFTRHLLDAVVDGGCGGAEARSVLGEMRAEHIEWARRRERRKMRKRAGDWVRKAKGLVTRERAPAVFDLEAGGGEVVPMVELCGRRKLEWLSVG